MTQTLTPEVLELLSKPGIVSALTSLLQNQSEADYYRQRVYDAAMQYASVEACGRYAENNNVIQVSHSERERKVKHFTEMMLHEARTAFAFRAIPR